MAVLRGGLTLFILVICGAAGQAGAQVIPGCGNLSRGETGRGYGPFDYTNPVHVKELLPVVEQHHLEPEIQRLQDAGDRSSVGGNLAYVLGAFPNHHRALSLMAEYELLTGQSPPRGASFTADCYFARAMAFKPTDGMVRMIYGNFLYKKGEKQKAREQYEKALGLLPGHPEVHYNFGLVLVDFGEYSAAMEHARFAYSAGFPLLGLRRKLESVGRWEWTEKAEK